MIVKQAIKKSTIGMYLAMTFMLMGTCEVFRGPTVNLRWNAFYYGNLALMLVLSLFIYCKLDKESRKQFLFFALLFCAPGLLKLTYSAILWGIRGTAFPYISRGVSNTLYQWIAYLFGVSFALRKRENITTITLSAIVTVFILAYAAGFARYGFDFIKSLNPLKGSSYTTYTELHEVSYILGLYLLLQVISVRKNNIRSLPILFWVAAFFFMVAFKRIGIAAAFVAGVIYLFTVRLSDYAKQILLKVLGVGTLLVCGLITALTVTGGLDILLQRFGIHMMGRDLLYGYFRRFCSFQITFPGHGVGFVTRQFDYATYADLRNMINTPALHSDFFKIFIEIGFIGFFLWLAWWLLGKPALLAKKYGVSKALLCLIVVLYSFILYTTDNAEGFTCYQMHLGSSITFLCCFYQTKEVTGEIQQNRLSR